MKRLIAILFIVLAPSLAWAQAGVTLYCGTSPSTALPCGAVGNPVYITGTITAAVAPTAAAPTVTSVTVTNSSASCGVAPARYLSIKNESTSASVAVNFAAGTAALNTAGNVTLGPGASYTFDSSFVPTTVPTCISSAASSPATWITN